MATQSSTLWRFLKSYQIYGANTNVGKTVISTILCKALNNKFPTEQTWYLKPISTGPDDQADDLHIKVFSSRTKTKCLYKFERAVSPHIAARSKFSKPVSDFQVRHSILAHIKSCAEDGQGTLILETAGGVNSPGPSGTLQGDLYQSLRLPVCLVADSNLGGISSTISAFESLHIRGYTVDALLLFENHVFQNHEYLKEYFKENGIQSFNFSPPPPRLPDAQEELESTFEYYSKMSESESVEELLNHLSRRHQTRIEKLEQMSKDAHAKIWYPFTQHKLVSPTKIMPIDSASGDFFMAACLKSKTSPSSCEDEAILSPVFDGSASWWTQGLGHASPTLSLAAAHAAGRFGHVMFAGNIHEPALTLANSLLTNLKNPRLSKVFFSDNGSTGVEVAIKMALSASYEYYGFSNTVQDVGVIGLKSSYHGDTIGAMDCSEPSVYNQKVHWYKGRGYWFDFPHVSMQNGHWNVILPEVITKSLSINSDKLHAQTSNLFNQIGNYDSSIELPPFFRFTSLGKIFDIEERKESGQADIYRQYIVKTLQKLIREEGFRFGALIMEPVLLGAGGMQLVDPLFQHILVDVVRNLSPINGDYTPHKTNTSSHYAWTGLPVIFDEVFTGLYRLGRFSAASFLQIHPDISVHAKLLTGGLVPLSCTLASESIYQAFISDSKTDALLHGHSYTAHPVGCHVANTSIQMLNRLDTCEAWQRAKIDWWCREEWARNPQEGRSSEGTRKSDIWEQGRQHSGYKPDVWSVWSHEFVHQLSCKGEILGITALGSVLAITLHDKIQGYNSTVSVDLQNYLFKGSRDLRVHIRILGNVVYIMASQISEPETLRKIEKLLVDYFSAEV
ncbi:Bifunctional dethiobiotin synthetase/7,8-diamino-pelargonic acid aminotransferase, mitochondrial [Erysiphe neolycopersici]|uniref:Bifunctional dethiobiotin synthetase/7,8-diamino-pelargonic acid aminotransferase, mitochondrial n=1 Tax=Erysiphe neolycopersici TaxID=212602 RepID=A0A420I1J4_9PEZI|nr:Bifunctional dethiobiotin synthetase/7,8-diamino-pelargonic acid aminotransferase, mitochondrial [Erysiphe neolycopersici]